MEMQDNYALIGAMFAWMNDGIARDTLSEVGFRRFFTSEAHFFVNGNLRGIGSAALFAFFSRQAKIVGGAVMQWPPIASFSASDYIFIDYDMAIGRPDTVARYNAKGYARVESGRIAHYAVNTFLREE